MPKVRYRTALPREPGSVLPAKTGVPIALPNIITHNARRALPIRKVRRFKPFFLMLLKLFEIRASGVFQMFQIHRLPPRSPHFPVHGRHLVHLGAFKLILGQLVGQTELLIFLILGWGTNKDLPVSRVRIDVVVFSVPLHQRHFIWRERFEMLLPLRSVSDDRSESCSREQVLCLLRISTAYSQG